MEISFPARFIATLDAVLTGTIQPLPAPDSAASFSAIAKTPREGKIRVSFTGLDGDEQADTKHHGGRDKAIHHYPFDHYAYWREHLPSNPVLAQVGAFGENFSTVGVTEEQLCIGDILRAGTAMLQVSQGRQPCATLNARFQRSAMAREVQTSGRTGWYYRVLEEGELAAGDALTLIERPHPQWTLARVLSVIDTRCLDKDILGALLEIGELSGSWKKLFTDRLERGEIEDWGKRLGE